MGTSFILNNIRNDRKQLRNLITVLNAPAKLQQSGGILFKTNLHDNIQHLGFVPAIIEGERSYHYNITLAHEDEYNLIGSVSANGEFKILFIPKSRNLTPEIKKRYTGDMASLAAFLIDAGYSLDAPLDWSTRKIIEELRVTAEIPETVPELATIRLD